MLVQQSVAIFNIYRFQWLKYHCGSRYNLCMTTKELYKLQLPNYLPEQIKDKSCAIVDCTACAKQRSYCKLLVRVRKECEEGEEPFSQWGPSWLFILRNNNPYSNSVHYCLSKLNWCWMLHIIMMNERTHLRVFDGYWSTLRFIETGCKLLKIIFIYNQILTYLEIAFYSIF